MNLLFLAGLTTVLLAAALVSDPGFFFHRVEPCVGLGRASADRLLFSFDVFRGTSSKFLDLLSGSSGFVGSSTMFSWTFLND